MPKVVATAEVINQGESYTSNVKINQHSLLVDEPVRQGGEDLGPAPGDYLCAALASCKAITLRMYIQRKKWKVEAIKVKVNLVLGKEMTSGNNTFYCQLQFTGDLDAEQEKRLLVIASSCPLHKLLSKPSDIISSVS